MRGSIKRQISVIFIGLVVAILLISLGVNAKFLGQYYILNKQASLTEVYEKLKTASEKGKLTSDSTVEELSEMVEIGNITLAVVSGKEKVRLSIAQNEQKSDELVMQLIGYMLGRNQENGTLLKESDTYQIHSAKDVQSGYEYIEMWGYLEDGSTFILRSPLESIRESVALSNKFLSYIVVVVVLISTVLVWYFSKRIADPIMELAVLSKRMADLDFDAKYTSGGDNEIGEKKKRKPNRNPGGGDYEKKDKKMYFMDHSSCVIGRNYKSFQQWSNFRGSGGHTGAIGKI